MEGFMGHQVIIMEIAINIVFLLLTQKAIILWDILTWNRVTIVLMKN